ncbi:B3 domain-containing protein Os11g0197600-like [Eucalyptus grandis]|uniref:B3 domain-containing protein Os11g0197600-like n=1 Tax=Eucalyptus grandis TaxID=71139 RepID=UPI00192ED06A|nr:B3 domain-containing protein Os11g0197600-like [Eucalyptus grandis]
MSQEEERVAANGRRACIFYRLMVDSLIHEKQLGIPKKFARKYGDELSDVVRLVASDSSIWLVELRKHGSRLWFHDGWQRFLEHHSIHSGHFLIFKYEGDSTFHVYVYNLTASWETNSHNPLGSKEFISSRQFPMHTKKNQDTDSVVEIRDLCCACPICSCLKDKCFQECRGWRTTNRIHDGVNIIRPEPVADWEVFHQDKGVQVDEVELQSTFDGVGIDRLFQKNRYRKRRKQINESSKHHNLDNYVNALSYLLSLYTYDEVADESEPSVMRKDGGELPTVEASYGKSSRECNAAIIEARGMAIRAAHMYEPNNPFFQNLPASFIGMHLKGDSRDITLQVSDGQKWRVRCLLFNGKGKISRGWREFVADNKLEIGDVCIFELLQREDIVLKVTIFRVPEIGVGAYCCASYSGGSSSMKLTFDSSQKSNGQRVQASPKKKGVQLLKELYKRSASESAECIYPSKALK